jgi:hypothetical protein
LIIWHNQDWLGVSVDLSDVHCGGQHEIRTWFRSFFQRDTIVSAHDSTWRAECAFGGVLLSCNGPCPWCHLEGGPRSRRASPSSGGRDYDSIRWEVIQQGLGELPSSRYIGKMIDGHSFSLSLLLELLNVFLIACSVVGCLSFLPC